MRVSRGMQSLGSGFPIGARVSLLAHDFALQSLVCYTFIERTTAVYVLRSPSRSEMHRLLFSLKGSGWFSASYLQKKNPMTDINR